MAYYAGGYYAGGYYAGGFLGNLFRGGAKIVGGAIGGFLAKGPIGAVVGAAASVPSAVSGNIKAETLAAGGTETALTPDLIAKHNAAVARGSTAGPLPQIPVMAPGMAIGAPGMLRGYRLNKSTYITRGGGTSRWPMAVQLHPKHTELVKGRRMNVANPRALRRALRRAQGFAKLARRFIVVTTRFKKGKRGVRRR